MMPISDPQPNDAFAWTQEPWGRALRCRHLAAPHFFTSRDLQLREDDREWSAVAATMGVAPDRLRLVKQVHGVHAVVARQGATAAWDKPQADIIVSNDPSVAIGVRVADCTPILLFDPVEHVVGAAHAGWRGTAANAATAAVRALHKEFGCKAANVTAAIGPCLGKGCGEVGPEVVDAFRAGGADRATIAAWFSAGTGDRSMLDLERANRDQLERAGVNPDAIYGSGLCTKTHRDRLHSYRADLNAAGRMLAAIRVAGT